MKTAIVISRFILGLGFVVFGLNILHPFLPQPPIPDGSLPARFMGVGISVIRLGAFPHLYLSELFLAHFYDQCRADFRVKAGTA